MFLGGLEVLFFTKFNPEVGALYYQEALSFIADRVFEHKVNCKGCLVGEKDSKK